MITSIADFERRNFPICDQTQDISSVEVIDGVHEVVLVLLESEVDVWMATGFGELINIRLRRGYDGCVDQLGTTKIQLSPRLFFVLLVKCS